MHAITGARRGLAALARGVHDSQGLGDAEQLSRVVAPTGMSTIHASGGSSGRPASTPTETKTGDKAFAAAYAKLLATANEALLQSLK